MLTALPQTANLDVPVGAVLADAELAFVDALDAAICTAATRAGARALQFPQVQPMRLRVALGIGAIAWTAAVAACVLWPDEVARFHLLEISLAYPAWYMWLSVTRGGFDRTNG